MKDWKLLKKITLEEETKNVYIGTDESGNSFECTKMIVNIVCSDSSRGQNSSMWYRFSDGNTKDTAQWAYIMPINGPAINYLKYSNIYVEKITDSLYRVASITDMSGSYTAAQGEVLQGLTILKTPLDKIRELKLFLQGDWQLPIGTIIEVYGK